MKKSERARIKMKEQMMDAVKDTIKARNLTQMKAAELLGISQPRVSQLMNGKSEDFRVDMLIKMLVKLGFDFSFSYNPKAKAGEPVLKMEGTASA